MSYRNHARVSAAMMLAGLTIMLWLGQALAATPQEALAVITAPRGQDQPAWLIVRHGADPARLRRRLPVTATGLQDAALSPDGRYLAYYTGAISRPGEPLIADLTLHVLRVADGIVVRAIPLAAPDFPANIDVTTALLRARDRDLATIVEMEEAVWVAYLDGLRRLAWSPDGTRLAFSGSMDGPTSDLYLYTPDDDTLTRLSDGIEQIDRLRWSPDGRWIWHSTVSFGYCQACDGGQYAASADGSAMITLPGNDIHRFLGWLDDATFLMTDQANGPGDFHLHSVRVDTGELASFWPGTHERFALDWSSQRMALVGATSSLWDPNVRLFVIDLMTNATEERDVNSISADDPDPLVAALAGPLPACGGAILRHPCAETQFNPLAPDGGLRVQPDGSVTDAAGQPVLPAAPNLTGGAILWQAGGSGYYVLKSGALAYRGMDTGTVRRLARSVQQVTWVRGSAP